MPERIQGFGWLFRLFGLGTWGFLFLYISAVPIQGDWACTPPLSGALGTRFCLAWCPIDISDVLRPREPGCSDGGHDG